MAEHTIDKFAYGGDTYVLQDNVSGYSKAQCYYTTCSTTDATAAKEITVTGWTPAAGDMLGVLFITANTNASPSLKVNGTSYTIFIGTTSPSATTNTLKWTGNTFLLFMFDGTYFRYIYARSSASIVPPDGAGSWYGTCSTSASTAAKTVSVTNFRFMKGAVVTVACSTANTVADALTLNVNSTGAKTVYYNGAATSSSNPMLWEAGAIWTFIYSGSYWYALNAMEPVDFTGAASNAAGAHGLVPAPASGETERLLRGNGEWATVEVGASQKSDGHLYNTMDMTSSSSYVRTTSASAIPTATTTADGVMSSTDKTKLDGLYGIPSGGTSGQVLAKVSATDYDVAWDTPSGSGQSIHTVLYDNPSGSNGDITLSQSAANFDYLKIFTFNTDGTQGYQSVEIHDPNGKYVFLSNIYTNYTHAWTQGRCVYINGTSITTHSTSSGDFYGTAQVDGSGTFNHSNFIYIYRVEGWNNEISEVSFPLTADQVPPIQNLTNYSARVYDATVSRTKNTFLAAPNGSNGAASFRSIVPADLGGPLIDIRQATTGSASRAANSSGTVALTLTAPTGFVIAHVLSVASNGGWVPAYVDTSVNDLFGQTSKSVNVQWANGFTNAQTCSFTVRFMCVRDGWAQKN